MITGAQDNLQFTLRPAKVIPIIVLDLVRYDALPILPNGRLLSGLLEAVLVEAVGPCAGFLGAGLPEAGVVRGWVSVTVRVGRHCVCVDQDFKVYLIKHLCRQCGV
jgi:hypothetical protein